MTQRELELMAWLGANGVATQTQIYRQFWATCRDQSACARNLRKLTRKGLLESRFVDLAKVGCGVQIFSLTEKAVKTYFPEIVRRDLLYRLPLPNMLNQQLLAQEAHYFLENCSALITSWLELDSPKLVSWKNERQLRREFGVKALGEAIPDAQALFQNATGPEITLAIEIDGGYSQKMLKAKIAEYLNSEQSLLWVTASPSRTKVVQKSIVQAGASEQIQVLSLQIAV